MKFWFVRSNNVVTVDDAPMSVDLSGVPANIYIVDWGGKDGTILYTDRVGVRDKFSDPSPYQTYINSWMLAAQNPTQNEIGTPSVQPVTLAQAQFVKTELVNSLFDLKRQAPIAVTIVLFDEKGRQVGTMSTTYDASDENVSNMQSQAIGEVVGTAGSGGLGASIVQLQNSINAAFATHDAYVSTYHNGITDFNNGVSAHVSGVNSVVTTVIDHASDINSTVPALVNNSFNLSTVTSSLSGSDWASGSVGSTFNPYPMSPLGTPSASYPAGIPGAPYPNTFLGSVSAGAVPGAVAPSSTQKALAAIMNRRNTLKTTQTTKQNQIGALTTVAAVAAYDITAGW